MDFSIRGRRKIVAVFKSIRIFNIKKAFSFALCILIMLSIISPITASADESEHKVVRVGWYESTYCYRDKFGRRRGIAYEYQQKVAAHTGWIYEYVEESWPNLLEMLKEGKIDLMSDVSYTKERSEQMLYPSLPMGAESYYVYIDADNVSITANNLQTLNGKNVGVNKDGIQEGMLIEWAQSNGIDLNVVELTIDESDSMELLTKGEIDALVSLDSFAAKERIIPVCKVGNSNYFFAVNKDRPDLLNELNTALAAIQDEDPYFNQRMFDEYIRLVNTNAFLSPRQESWLARHGTIRIGYRDELLAAFEKQMDDNLGQGKITIASGCAVFDPSQDKSTHAVLERADAQMYERKKQMKKS